MQAISSWVAVSCAIYACIPMAIAQLKFASTSKHESSIWFRYRNNLIFLHRQRISTAANPCSIQNFLCIVFSRKYINVFKFCNYLTIIIIYSTWFFIWIFHQCGLTYFHNRTKVCITISNSAVILVVTKSMISTDTLITTDSISLKLKYKLC